MNLREMMAKAYRTMIEEKCPETPSTFYALLFDVCGSDYEGKEAARRFVEVDKRVGLFTMVRDGSLAEAIKEKYSLVADLVSQEEYDLTTDDLLEVASCDGNISLPASPAGGAASPAAPQASPVAVQAKVVGGKKRKRKSSGHRGSTGSGQYSYGSSYPGGGTSATTSATTSASHYYNSGSPIRTPLGVLAIIALSAVFILWLIVGSGWRLQHVFGSVGGLLLFGAFYVTCKNSLDNKEYVFAEVLVGVTVLASAVLGIALAERDRFVAIWLEGYAVLSSVYLTCRTFSDSEEECGVAAIVECLFALIALLLLIVMDRLVWNDWQHVIGSFGGLAFFVLLWFICALVLDFDYEEAFFGHYFAIVPVLIVNTVLRFVLKDVYFTIAMWVGSFAILSCVISVVMTVSDGEEEFVLVPIIETIGSITALVLMAVL